MERVDQEKWKRKLPPPPTPASDRNTRPRPATHMAAPNSCHNEYRVPRTIHVKTITHATVQQANNVTLVIDENWNALLTASKTKIKN